MELWEQATRLYIKEIRGCSGLLTMSIHEHVVLSVLRHEHHEHYTWQDQGRGSAGLPGAG
jgi:hypothetical protein